MQVELAGGHIRQYNYSQPFYEISFLGCSNPRDMLRIAGINGLPGRIDEEGFWGDTQLLKVTADLKTPYQKGSRRYTLVPSTNPSDTTILAGGIFKARNGWIPEAIYIDEHDTTGELFEEFSNGSRSALDYEVAYLAQLQPGQRVASTWFDAWSDTEGKHMPHRKLVVNANGLLKRAQVSEAGWEKIAASDLQDLLVPTPSFWKRVFGI